MSTIEEDQARANARVQAERRRASVVAHDVLMALASDSAHCAEVERTVHVSIVPPVEMMHPEDASRRVLLHGVTANVHTVGSVSSVWASGRVHLLDAGQPRGGQFDVPLPARLAAHILLTADMREAGA